MASHPRERAAEALELKRELCVLKNQFDGLPSKTKRKLIAGLTSIRNELQRLLESMEGVSMGHATDSPVEELETTLFHLIGVFESLNEDTRVHITAFLTKSRRELRSILSVTTRKSHELMAAE